MTARIAIASMLAMLVFGTVTAKANEKPLSLVPLPLTVERKTGEFAIDKDTTIVFRKDSTDAANVGRLLAERLKNGTGFDLKVAPVDSLSRVPNTIVLAIVKKDLAKAKEGYALTVSSDDIVIVGQDGAGLFYGMQTLLQLLPPQVFGDAKTRKTTEAIAWTVPAVKIKDRPRFGWRGLMLDVGRHFFNKAEIKQFLDLMAQHKLNTFHWHLTDHDGWRIEIKRYPKLTTVGAWRTGIEYEYGLDPKARPSTAFRPDGRYGGFFTQDDVREIVAYAKDRYITVVPEIEMPGHSGAALRVYREYNCPGCNNGIYCAGNDASFEFLEGVLSEVLELFPSKYIHIGGDEVPKDNWKKCPKCQARIKKENLKNENELQSYFVRRIEKYLNSKGRTLIGWDEILDGGLAPNATVMGWRGVEYGIAAANAGHDVVMTPTTYCYLDYYQAHSGEPLGLDPNMGLTPGWYASLPLEKVYSFEPIQAKIAPDKAKHVLGAGGNLWTEFIPNFAQAQYMAYPRTCALAEVVWTAPKLKNWADFSRRLQVHLERLKVQGVNYRVPRAGDLAMLPTHAAAPTNTAAPKNMTVYGRPPVGAFCIDTLEHIEGAAKLGMTLLFSYNWDFARKELDVNTPVGKAVSRHKMQVMYPLSSRFAQVRLARAITPTDTTIPVVGEVAGSVMSFPKSGYLMIEGERIEYATRDTKEGFGGCRRGAGGTQAATHGNGLLLCDSEALRKDILAVKDAPGLWGYWLVDDSRPQEIDSLREMSRIIRLTDRDAQGRPNGHIIVMGIGATSSMANFDVGICDALGVYLYPYHEDKFDAVTRNEMRFIMTRARSLQPGIGLLGIYQAFAHDSLIWRNMPTPKQVREDMLSYYDWGADGVMAFLYHCDGANHVPQGLDAFPEVRDMIGRTNKEILAGTIKRTVPPVGKVEWSALLSGMKAKPSPGGKPACNLDNPVKLASLVKANTNRFSSAEPFGVNWLFYPLKVSFPAWNKADPKSDRWPLLQFAAGNLTTTNWSRAGALEQPIYNTGELPITVLISLKDTSKGEWARSIELPPHVPMLLRVPMDEARLCVDLRHIQHWMLWETDPPAAVEFRLGTPVLTPAK